MSVTWPASSLLMLRPAHFGYNWENTDNTFGQPEPDGMCAQQQALAEFDEVVNHLEALGLSVYLLADHSASPDAIFPNNWLSLHSDGSVILYPMKAPSRRSEVRWDISQELVAWGFEVTRLVNWTHWAEQGQYLEGTGSLVLDPSCQRVYAALSERTDPGRVQAFADLMGLEAFCFQPLQLPDAQGQKHAIYHTNVLLMMGVGFAVWCSEAVPDAREAQLLKSYLQAGGTRQLVDLSLSQVRAFAGNMLQVHGPQGPLLLMSDSARQALTAAQTDLLKQHTGLVVFSIPTIERIGGGSLRCMLAEIGLPLRAG